MRVRSRARRRYLETGDATADKASRLSDFSPAAGGNEGGGDIFVCPGAGLGDGPKQLGRKRIHARCHVGLANCPDVWFVGNDGDTDVWIALFGCTINGRYFHDLLGAVGDALAGNKIVDHVTDGVESNVVFDRQDGFGQLFTADEAGVTPINPFFSQEMS